MTAALEFCLPPAEVPRLLRLSAITRRAGRPGAVERVWHDTADGALAEAGLSLSEQKDGWRLERASPAPGVDWPVGAPAPLIEAAPALDGIGHSLPGPLMPLAGFRGRQRVGVLGENGAAVDFTLLEGALHGVTREAEICRVTLTGPAPLLLTLSSEIGAAVRLTAPRWSLAAQALALARGIAPAPRHTGAPTVPACTALGDAVGLVVSHLIDVILTGVSTIAAAPPPEPVHQTRVAVRRLRSALSIFRRAVNPAPFEAVAPGLKHLAAVLGAARDWDVFLDGAGRAVAAALPEERRIATMLETGERRRAAAYTALAAYLAGPAFQALELSLIQLAALQPWRDGVDEDQAVHLARDAEHYATAMFGRRLEHMLAPGADISELPSEDLHGIRKAGKRLRYAAEFFAPLYGRRGGRRFVDRLSTLQEALGHLNDTVAARSLMATLGSSADRQFAAGAVQGFVAARQGDTRRDIGRAWSKFRRQEPFWT